ncbi:MAG: hypothetical protein HOG49_31725 [Candidatus Scalindua sp.]|nr:hypothetical protein [Candidatus Scalindua sp.]
MTEIDTRFYNKDQSWYFIRIVKWNNHKLKVVIRRNAYDHQSYAKCYKFDGKQWNVVNSMPIEDCKCQVVSYAQKEVDARKELFLQDSQTLFEIAKKIIK